MQVIIFAQRQGVLFEGKKKNRIDLKVLNPFKGFVQEGNGSGLKKKQCAATEKTKKRQKKSMMGTRKPASVILVPQKHGLLNNYLDRINGMTARSDHA